MLTFACLQETVFSWESSVLRTVVAIDKCRSYFEMPCKKRQEEEIEVKDRSEEFLANISVPVHWRFQSCACVRKGVKRFVVKAPPCPVLVEDLSCKCEIRRRKTGFLHDDLLTTTSHNLSGHRLLFDPAT